MTVSGALGEPRPFASLSPSLLARKGAARPAMRRQDTASFGLSGMRMDAARMEDLGWNDWGLSETPQVRTELQAETEVAHLAPFEVPHVAVVPEAFVQGEGVQGEGVQDEAVHAVAAGQDAVSTAALHAGPAPAAELSVWSQPAHVDVAPDDHFDEDTGEDGSTSAPMASLAPEVPAFAARKPDVLRQIDDLAERINRPVAPARNLVTEGRRAAFTLRLDAERHFRLKMAGLLLNRSAQVIVTEALDKYLAEFADLSSPAFTVGTRS